MTEETKQSETKAIEKKKKTFSTSLVPKNVQEASQMSIILSKSNVVPRDFQGKPESCFVAIGMGMELGLPPLQAIQNIMVVNGRPTLWGDAVLALVRSSDKCEWIVESDPEETKKTGVAKCAAKRKGDPQPVVRVFSLEDAKRANLLNKPGPWTTYQSRMLQMRARSWALRDAFPDLLKGVGVREEVEDFDKSNIKEAITINDVFSNGAKKPEKPSSERLDNAKQKFEEMGVPGDKFDDYVNGLSLEDEISLFEHLIQLYKGIQDGTQTKESVFGLEESLKGMYQSTNKKKAKK